jgi:TetR/AcrR family transcriptional repressor of mexJK operon
MYRTGRPLEHEDAAGLGRHRVQGLEPGRVVLLADAARRGHREERRQDRRNAILKVATHSFMKFGYAATSMSSIAAAAGGSKATLWAHFPSKEALFEAVLAEATDAHQRDLVTLLDPRDNLTVALRRYCRCFIQTTTSPSAIALQRLVEAEAVRFPEVSAVFYERVPKTTRNLLARFIDEAMAKGELRRDDAAQAAEVIISLCLGGSHQRILWSLAEPDQATIDAEAAFVTDVFLRAYAPITSQETPDGEPSPPNSGEGAGCVH